MDSLWPQFEEQPKVRTPISILNEQAAELGNQFKNQIRALVRVDAGPGTIRQSLYLVCSGLDYRYRLFVVEYELVPTYPVAFMLEGDIADEVIGKRGGTVIQANDETQFVAILQAIFSSTKAAKVINALRQHIE